MKRAVFVLCFAVLAVTVVGCATMSDTCGSKGESCSDRAPPEQRWSTAHRRWLLAGVCGGLRYMPNGSVSVRGRIGALAAREAGARVCAADGSPFPEDIRAPHSTLLVAADDETLAALQLAAVAAVGA